VTARDRIVLAVIGAVAVLAAFWYLVLAPKRDDAKALDAKISAAQTRLTTAQSSASDAEAAKARYDRDYATVARLGKAVPVDDDVPSLVYQLEAASHTEHVDFRKIDLSTSSTAGASAPSNAANAAKSTTTTSTTTTSTPGASAGGLPTTATSSASTASTTLPPGATVGAAGFPTMPFAFSFDGSFFHMEDFLRRLDRLTTVRNDSIDVKGRLLTVDGITLKASSKGFPQVNASLAATAYLLPADEGLTNGASSSSPGSAPTSASGTPSAADTFRSDR
jgi:hypothetical protein